MAIEIIQERELGAMIEARVGGGGEGGGGGKGGRVGGGEFKGRS